jgi:hypothetical protein
LPAKMAQMYTIVAVAAQIARGFEVVETFLNLIWLLIALAALAVWRYRWLPNRVASRSRAVPEFVALVCALALLFPAISLTDDLHPVIVAVDAASGKRNGSALLARALHASQAAPKATTHAWAVLAPSAPLTFIGASRLILLDENFRSEEISPNHHGRSPPSSLV